MAIAAAAVIWRVVPKSDPGESLALNVALNLPPQMSLRPEVTLPGNQFEPRLSPHGDVVAFAWQAPGSSTGWDLWLQEIGGDQPVQLTDHPHHERLPAWSSDGLRLAFLRFSPDGEECALSAVEVLSRRVERLAECHPGTRSLAWSPDSRWLAYDGSLDTDVAIDTEAADSSEAVPGDFGRPGPRAVFALELATGQQRQLTDPPAAMVGDTGVRFSPDGQWLAFEREMTLNGSELGVVEVETRESRVISSESWGRIRGLDWSSDGETLLVSSDRSGQYELWLAPLDGTAASRLAVTDRWVTQPTVARAGGRLIYRTFRDKVDVWTLALGDGLEPSADPSRVAESSRSERQPTVTRSEKRIAFLSDRSGSLQLWSATPDGDDLRRHTSFQNARPAAPSFSPDDQTIVFERVGPGRTDIWSVDVDSRLALALVEGSGNSRNPSYSNDGDTIFFATDEGGTWQIRRRTLGSQEQDLTLGDPGGFRPLTTTDDAWLVYSRVDAPGLWRVPTDGGPSEQLTAELALDDWGTWDVTERGIFYVTRDPAVLWLLSLDGKETTRVTDIPLTVPYLEPALHASPSGDRVWMSLIESGDDELMSLTLAGL